jgi:hypothetical protein
MNIQQGTQNDELGYRHADVPPDFDIGHFLFDILRFIFCKLVLCQR